MSGSVIERYVNRVPEPARKPSASEDPDALDDLGAFSILRGVRERALMLELRMKDGSVTALSYAYLSKAVFDPSEGITLQFGGSTVRIAGTNLATEVRPNVQLFQSLLRHRVPWVCEADRASSLRASAGAIVIDEIRIEP